MIGIVIVAHGGLAKEYLLAMEHVVGKLPAAEAVAIEAEADLRSKKAEVDAAVKAVDRGDGVVVVTDMFGSTPANLAVGACRKTNDRTVLYGANLPMLVKLAKERHRPLRDAVSCALTAGRKYINSVDGVGENGTPVPV